MRHFLSILLVAIGQSVFAAEKIPSDTQNLKNGKAFTLAVLPDTQFYCDTRLKLSKKWGNGDLRRYFFEQTRWVRDNQKRLNIAFLVHEGDLVRRMPRRNGLSQRKQCLSWTGRFPIACAWETMTWVLRRRITNMAVISALIDHAFQHLLSSREIRKAGRIWRHL